MLNQVRFRDEFLITGRIIFGLRGSAKQKPQLQGFRGERCDITVPPKLAVKYPWLRGAMNSNRGRMSSRHKVFATGSLGYGQQSSITDHDGTTRAYVFQQPCRGELLVIWLITSI